MDTIRPENIPLTCPKPLRYSLHLEMDWCDWQYLCDALACHRDNKYLKSIDVEKTQMLIDKIATSLRPV